MAKTKAPSSRWAGGLAILGILATWGDARGQEAPSPESENERKKACVDQHEQAQHLRRAAQLKQARDALLVCTRDSCPSAVRADCLDWLDAVGRAIPSVVVSARLGTDDELNVRLSIDRELVATRLDGKPIELNPGPHVFRFEINARDPIEQQVLLSEGERNRMVAVSFPNPKEASESSAVPRASDGSDLANQYRPIPLTVYVLGGVALAGAGAFAGFGLSGLAQRSSLQSTCQPVCSTTDVASVRSKLIAADVSLGVAVLSTAVAGYVYFSRPTKVLPRQPGTARAAFGVTSIGLTRGPAGGLLTMQGEF
jgi:hypothetical protein